MDNMEFKRIVEEQLNHCVNLLGIKSNEYDFGDDRLHSFKVAGDLLHRTPKEALLGYMTKHIISVYDMCRSDKSFDLGKWTEKIGDSINYLLLLKGLIVEENQHEVKDNRDE